MDRKGNEWEGFEGIDCVFDIFGSVLGNRSDAYYMIAAEELKEIVEEKSKALSPERCAIRRDLFRKLSREAKDVLRLALLIPSEFADFLFRGCGHVTMKSLQKFLRSRGWPHRRISKTFNELGVFLRDI